MVNKKPIQLLIVEDEEIMVDLFRQHLANEKEPVEAAYCSTLREAEIAIAENKPDISVLDLHLPDSEGVSTFKRFRQFADGLIVIVCSGFLDLTTKRALYDLGAAAVLDKPFDWGAMFALIRTKASPGISKLESIIETRAVD